MAMDGISVGDALALERNAGNGWGGDGGWFGMIILFALIFGWGGNGFGNRGGDNPVTESGLCNAMNFNDLENAVGRLSDNQAAIARQTDNAICNLGYSALQQTNETQRQIAECCCTTQRAIDGVNFNMAEQTQKVLDTITTNRMADMQNQINQLQLQSALCGVVRWPQQATWNGGQIPFFGNNCGCGCGCGCNNI